MIDAFTIFTGHTSVVEVGVVIVAYEINFKCFKVSLGLFQENPRGWGGPETNFFFRGGGCNLISVFLVLGVKNISVFWVVGVKLVV